MMQIALRTQSSPLSQKMTQRMKLVKTKKKFLIQDLAGLSWLTWGISYLLRIKWQDTRLIDFSCVIFGIMLKYDIAPKTTYTWKALNQIDQFLFRNCVWIWYWSGIVIGIMASFLIVFYLIVFSNFGLILLLLLITSCLVVFSNHEDYAYLHLWFRDMNLTHLIFSIAISVSVLTLFCSFSTCFSMYIV